MLSVRVHFVPSMLVLAVVTKGPIRLPLTDLLDFCHLQEMHPRQLLEVEDKLQL